MPQVSRFGKLPQVVQREIEKRLVENGFSDYEQIAAELRQRGYRISRSSLHRAGKALKARVALLRDQYLAQVAQIKDIA